MKRLLLLIAFVLLSSAVLLGTQTTLDTDTFGGVAGTTLHNYNANWLIAPIAGNYNDFIISTPNGGAKAQGQSGSIRTGQTWTNDQFAQATFSVLPTGIGGVCVRCAGDNTNFTSGYVVGIIPGLSGNNKWVVANATTGTAITTSATDAVAGDVVNVQVVGTAITVSINGTHLADLDTTSVLFATGEPGFYAAAGEPVFKATSWSAGSASNGSTGVPGGLSLLGVGR